MSAEVTQEGKSTRIKYKGAEILTLMSLGDARAWSKSFEDAVDLYGSKGWRLVDWLAGHAAIDPATRDRLMGDDQFPAQRLPNEKVRAAIEHTDPAWRHLGVDETAGDPDLREFEKTDAGFVRAQSAEKSPGVPADPEDINKRDAPPTDEELEDIMESRGTPEPGDIRTAMDPVFETPKN